MVIENLIVYMKKSLRWYKISLKQFVKYLKLNHLSSLNLIAIKNPQIFINTIAWSKT